MYVHPDLLCAEAAIRRAMSDWWDKDFQAEYFRLHRLLAMYRRPKYSTAQHRKDRLEEIERHFRQFLDRWQAGSRVKIACYNEQTIFLAYYLYTGRVESLLGRVTTYILPPFVPWMWGEAELDRLARVARRLIPIGISPSGKPVEVIFHPLLCNVSRVIKIMFAPEEVRMLEFLYVPPPDD